METMATPTRRDTGNGVEPRLAAVERDHAVTRTKLDTLTDNVDRLTTVVTGGFDRLGAMISEQRTVSSQVGKFSGSQLIACGGFILSIGVASVGIFLWVLSVSIDAQHREHVADVLLLNERLRSMTFQDQLLGRGSTPPIPIPDFTPIGGHP